MSVREVVREFCPVHWPESRECWDACLPERVQFQAAAHALQQYWYGKRHPHRQRCQCVDCGGVVWKGNRRCRSCWRRAMQAGQLAA